MKIIFSFCENQICKFRNKEIHFQNFPFFKFVLILLNHDFFVCILAFQSCMTINIIFQIQETHPASASQAVVNSGLVQRRKNYHQYKLLFSFLQK